VKHIRAGWNKTRLKRRRGHMGTEVETKKAGELLSIALADLIPTKDNPRKIDPKDASIAELAKSLQEEGQLVPAIARPHPKKKGKFDLRAGHRRLIAAGRAGLPTLLVIVRDLSDQQALEVTVTENLQREDLTPLEEAAGVGALLKGGWKTADIAAHIGKSPEWVIRRANLTKLSPAWRKLAGSPQGFSISAAALEMVAKLPAKVQDAVKRDCRDWAGCTAANMSKILAGWTLALKAAPFDAADATLDPAAGPCAKCKKRSSVQPGLFDDLDKSPEKIKAGDRCLDRRCWQKKAGAMAKAKVDELRKDHKRVLRLYTDYWEDGRSKPEGAIPVNSYDWVKVKPGTKGAVPGVVVHGKGKGAVHWMKERRDEYSSGRGKREPGKPTPLSTRRKQLQARRDALFIRSVRSELDVTECAKEKLRVRDEDTELHDRLGVKRPAVTTGLVKMGALAIAWGAASVDGIHNPKGYAWMARQSKGGSSWKAVDRLAKLRGKKAAAAVTDGLWPGVKLRLDQRLGEDLNVFPRDGVKHYSVANAKRIARLIGVDPRELRRKVEEKIRVPKTWANLKPDGTPKKRPEKKAKPKAKKKPAKKKARKNKATAA